MEWRIFVKISAFSLIIFDGISESWQISFKISSLSTHLKENWRFFLHTSPIVSMLRWFLYFTIAFKTVSWMLSANGCQLFEKKVFKTLAVSSTFLAILSIRVIFWVDVTLSDSKSFIIFQNVSLSVIIVTSRLLWHSLSYCVGVSF